MYIKCLGVYLCIWSQMECRKSILNHIFGLFPMTEFLKLKCILVSPSIFVSFSVTFPFARWYYFSKYKSTQCVLYLMRINISYKSKNCFVFNNLIYARYRSIFVIEHSWFVNAFNLCRRTFLIHLSMFQLLISSYTSITCSNTNKKNPGKDCIYQLKRNKHKMCMPMEKF